MADEKENRKIPTPVNFDLRTNLTCNVRCNSCIYFENRAHSKYKEPCNSLGILAKSTPCNKFTPNPAKLNFRSDKILRQISRVLAKIGKEHLPLIASVLLRESKTRNKGFNFGQVVYVRIFGDDYISNYRKAYVVFAERKLVYLTGGKNINSETEFTASVGTQYVLSSDQWEKKKSALKAQGKLKDPKLPRYIKVTKKPSWDYEPPTIDDFWKLALKPQKDKKTNLLKTNFVDVNVSDDVAEVMQTRS